MSPYGSVRETPITAADSKIAMNAGDRTSEGLTPCLRYASRREKKNIRSKKIEPPAKETGETMEKKMDSRIHRTENGEVFVRSATNCMSRSIESGATMKMETMMPGSLLINFLE